MSRPYCIAHRGGTGCWPENTIAAFRNAVELGVDGIEFDVHLSADGAIVVHHDATTNPATTRRGGQWITDRVPLGQLSLAELRELDVGTLNPALAYGERFPEQTPVDGAGIPTLEEVLEVVPRDRWLLVEIKTSVTERLPTTAVHRLVDAVIERLRAADRLAEKSMLLAFDWRALARAQATTPALPRAHSTVPQAWLRNGVSPGQPGLSVEQFERLRLAGETGDVDWIGGVNQHATLPGQVAQHGGQFWIPNFRDVDADAVAAAAAVGIDLIPWTVDAPEDLSRLMDLGVWGVMTDRPDRWPVAPSP